jgi:hypothetical protein
MEKLGNSSRRGIFNEKPRRIEEVKHIDSQQVKVLGRGGIRYH